MYCGVPAISAPASAAAVAMPKSVMRTSPLPSSITLAGFRSRCSTPRSCAAATPAHSCRAICDRLVRRHPAETPQRRRQVLAVDVLHRQEPAAVGVAQVVEPADVLVRHLARHAQLVVELREPGVARRHAVGQELQRDRLVERQVVGAVHLAHAAAAEQRHQPVAARDDGARRETPPSRRRRARRHRERRRAGQRVEGAVGIDGAGVIRCRHGCRIGLGRAAPMLP